MTESPSTRSLIVDDGDPSVIYEFDKNWDHKTPGKFSLFNGTFSEPTFNGATVSLFYTGMDFELHGGLQFQPGKGDNLPPVKFTAKLDGNNVDCKASSIFVTAICKTTPSGGMQLRKFDVDLPTGVYIDYFLYKANVTFVSPSQSASIPAPNNANPTGPSSPSSSVEASGSISSTRKATGALVGGAVAGAICILLLIILLSMLYRRRKRRRAQNQYYSEKAVWSMLSASPPLPTTSPTLVTVPPPQPKESPLEPTRPPPSRRRPIILGSDGGNGSNHPTLSSGDEIPGYSQYRRIAGWVQSIKQSGPFNGGPAGV